jgi:transposase
MRKSFSGLVGMVRTVLNQDPLSGHYFFFLNKGKNYLKVLTWDGTGYCIFAKKLPRGVFSVPQSKEYLLQELMALLSAPETPGRKGASSQKVEKYRYIPA